MAEARMGLLSSMPEIAVLALLHDYERHQVSCRKIVALADRLLALPPSIVGVDERVQLEGWRIVALEGDRKIGEAIDAFREALVDVETPARVM